MRNMHCRFSDLCFLNHYTKVLIVFQLHQPRSYCLFSQDFVSNLCIRYEIVKRLPVVLGWTLSKPRVLAANDPLLERVLFGR